MKQQLPNLPHYPVEKIRKRIIETLHDSTAAIIQAAPGSGKSTLVPLYILNSHWRQNRTIFLLQPRRAAARAVARRLAELAGPGTAIGWITKTDQRVPENPDILVMTEGIFVQKIIQNPELPECAAVILDEFHERSVQADLSYVFIRESMEALRPDLRLLIMSATMNHAGLDGSKIPLLSAEGRLFPVDISYNPCPPGREIPRHAAQTAVSMLSRTHGGILIFLPGEREIRNAESILKSILPAEDSHIVLHPLYSRLSSRQQRIALAAPSEGTRKIVIATNIAETSLTIEGITCVIDSGEQRSSVYDDSMGINRLHTRRISKASAIQRAGRAGRLEAGYAVRLWSESEQLDDFHSPEIGNIELSSLLLHLAAWGQSDPSAYTWPDPPPAQRIPEAMERLRSLGALNSSGSITKHGKIIHALPLEPRLAAMCITAYRKGGAPLLQRAAIISAIIEMGDPFTSEARREHGADLYPRLEILENALHSEGRFAPPADEILPGTLKEIHPGTLKEIRREVGRIVKAASRFLGERGEDGENRSGNEEVSPAGLLMEAYPSRLARKTGNGSYTLISGGSYAMKSGDRSFSPEWIAAPVLHRRAAGGSIFLAAALEEHEVDTLIRQQAQYADELLYRNGSLSARQKRYLGKIELAPTPLNINSIENLERALTNLVHREGMRLFNWTQHARELQARIQFIFDLYAGSYLSSQPWPNPSDTHLADTAEQWLPSFLPAHPDPHCLQHISMVSVLKSMIPWDAAAEFEIQVPRALELPSGSRRTLRYEKGRVILDARIQQLFGMRKTPTIAGVPLEIELLSPAGRPVQITSDMSNFWNTTYPEVRKELRGRYPKHYWPEDPLHAAATDRVRPQKK